MYIYEVWLNSNYNDDTTEKSYKNRYHRASFRGINLTATDWHLTVIEKHIDEVWFNAIYNFVHILII